MKYPVFADYAGRLLQFMERVAPVRREESAPPCGEFVEVFDRLALELFCLQFAANSSYRSFCERRGVTPETVFRWDQIPVLPVEAFKEFEVTCLPASDRTGYFQSSGTTEQVKSRHWHNAESLAVYEASLWPWFARHVCPEGIGGETGAQVLVLTPRGSAAPHSSLVHMFEVVARHAGEEKCLFAGKVDERGDWCVDFSAVDSSLEKVTSEHRPVIVMGTAFSFVHLLDEWKKREISLKLPHGSRVLETGGYKGRSRVVSKEELHRMIASAFGISPAEIVSEYGMCELSSQAYDCMAGFPNGVTDVTLPPPQRVFHFPPWARARIVSPETGEEVLEGGTGLIQVFDLANICSCLAIQTGDLGVRRKAGFELVGRVQPAGPRGCSLMAA